MFLCFSQSGWSWEMSSHHNRTRFLQLNKFDIMPIITGHWNRQTYILTSNFIIFLFTLHGNCQYHHYIFSLILQKPLFRGQIYFSSVFSHISGWYNDILIFSWPTSNHLVSKFFKRSWNIFVKHFQRFSMKMFKRFTWRWPVLLHESTSPCNRGTKLGSHTMGLVTQWEQLLGITWPRGRKWWMVRLCLGKGSSNANLAKGWFTLIGEKTCVGCWHVILLTRLQPKYDNNYHLQHKQETTFWPHSQCCS